MQFIKFLHKICSIKSLYFLVRAIPMTTASLQSNQKVDCILSARWIATVDKDNTLLENHSVVIKDDIIIDVLPTDQIESQYHSVVKYPLGDSLLIPGLINTHGHLAMSLMKGIADDLPLQTWLEQHIWPKESKFVDESFVFDGTRLAMAEMLKTGTTSFADMYFFPDSAIEAVESFGVHATFYPPVLDFPTQWAQNSDEYIAKALALSENYLGHKHIQVGFGPHAPYTVSDAPLIEVAKLAADKNLNVQIHVHETAFEVEQSLQQHQMRPLKRLEKLGVLSTNTQCVHMTQIAEEDVEILKAAGSHVIHCPESNLKLASGFCPINTLKNAGINVALGTDGAASNNDLDLLGEMKTASLLAKGVAQDASAINADESLRMATINGAKALGIEKQRGSLEIGKVADIVAINFDKVGTLPLYNPISQLVYSSNSSVISHVWVGGKCAMSEGKLSFLDEDNLIKIAQKWSQKLSV